MDIMSKKRGLSPVIATSLLIAIALVLALIIFLWARSFVGEVIQKEGEPIENSCALVDFEADVFADKINIVNRGNIPLYGVEIKKSGFGTIEGKAVFTKTISNGQDAQLSLSTLNGELRAGDKVSVIPIIVGESNSGKKQYSCIKNAESMTVIDG